jgi:hypothetical protein
MNSALNREHVWISAVTLLPFHTQEDVNRGIFIDRPKMATSDSCTAEREGLRPN